MRRTILCLVATLGLACHLTPEQAVVVDDVEQMACVLSEALVRPATAEVIAEVCKVPLGDVVRWLTAQREANKRVEEYYRSHK